MLLLKEAHALAFWGSVYRVSPLLGGSLCLMTLLFQTAIFYTGFGIAQVQVPGTSRQGVCVQEPTRTEACVLRYDMLVHRGV